MVLWKNVFLNIRYHVVQMDISEIAYRSIAKPRMEISFTDQYVQYFISNTGGNNGLAFLGRHTPLPLRGDEGSSVGSEGILIKLKPGNYSNNEYKFK